ncbi:hypothetical protein ACUN7V_18155 [Quadrisphaera oryzae]|uniref:hypothetical protein n=1 Tax=Quadrisphaera TaxID=317661 RepID=UPI001645E27F|nr:hypothetical protein [Quadrisphaera sp. RL12-1S]MBC3760950.1 hypothetical protein [Quadrisphaera sp. RL12-1S]
MTRAWWTGAALLALGLSWQITDRVLRTLYPLSWGGPNIGGFFIYVAAQVVAGAGLLTVVASGALLAAHRVRLGRGALLVPVVAAAVLVVALQVVNRVLPGDTGPDGGLAGVNGQVGLAADAAGDPVLVLEVCRGAVDTISVVGPNTGGTNAFIAALQAPAPVTAPTTVPLLAPPSGWTGAPASLPLDSVEFVIVSASGRQSELRQVDFGAAELASVVAAGPDAVLYSAYDPEGDRGSTPVLTTRAGFHELACAGFPDASPTP